ncbi:class I SAM-dependent methyltransferase [Deinococcus aestuarii]|uniref:class I SAM-dependent methyltransferase n=1 Tax=Deinococcus aestuarii TaxID=2774531 RepID=UPI001C0B6B4C|nr:class I SAM-dependent methyltransferase [Deinococcus aestuarii]
MTNMERRCSLSESAALAARDRVLSRLVGVEWPFSPLLGLLNPPPAADLLDVGARGRRLLRTLWAQGHIGRPVGLDPQPGRSDVPVGEANALPFAGGAFDVVTLVRVLGHLPNTQAV